MKILVKNKKAFFDYEIKEKLEAGIVLTGQEVKSIKKGGASLKGSYVIIRPNREVYLVNAHVSPYQPANTPSSYQPNQMRKLLLNKREINTLAGRIKQEGLTLIPLKLYTKGGKIKVEIALVRGRKKSDKREKLKKREIDKKIRRALKVRGR